MLHRFFPAESEVEHPEEDKVVRGPDVAGEGELGVHASNLPERSLPLEAQHGKGICQRPQNEARPICLYSQTCVQRPPSGPYT